MGRKLLAIALAFVLPALLGGMENKPVDVPPEPPMPDTSSLTESQSIAAIRNWQEALRKWHSSLTPEQQAELDRRRDEARERFGRIPTPKDNYDWASEARSRGLTPQDVERLGSQKLLIGTKTFRQSFEAYVGPRGPMFITSDSLLNAFSSIFEDSFRELEIRRVGQLRGHLEETLTAARHMLETTPYVRADLEPGWLQAQRTLGPAMVLLGSQPELFDPELRREISFQVEKIRAADSVALPDWLAPRSESFLGIDYRRFRPLGFYAGHSKLANYFRAVRWLQTVPFRIERDQELVAILILGRASVTSQSYLAEYESFLGPRDSWSLNDAGDPTGSIWQPEPGPDWGLALRTQRALLLSKSVPSLINSDLRSRAPNQEPFHILAEYRLPDAAMFQYLADHNESASGLELAAAVGSTWAKDRIRSAHPKIMARGLEIGRRLALGDRETDREAPLYNEYLWTLATLFEPPVPEAPAFMKSDAWSAKSCQTATAGWAQMRHTFTLQAKETIVTTGIRSMPPGFIEPNPAFLRQFTKLVQDTEGKLRVGGAFEESGVSSACRILDAADMVAAIQAKIESEQPYSRQRQYEDFMQFASEFAQPGGAGDLLRDENRRLARDAYFQLENEPSKSQAILAKLVVALRDDASRYERGELVTAKNDEEWRSLPHRWQDLEHEASILDSLLQKQLKRETWTVEDGKSLKEYGSAIATVMGYFGNEYMPRDDAPRWAEVVRDPKANDSFAAATGRPHSLFVLYPWNGLEVLCEGAVIPYYDDHSPDILTDAEWRDKLDSSKAPRSPDWLLPIRGIN